MFRLFFSVMTLSLATVSCMAASPDLDFLEKAEKAVQQEGDLGSFDISKIKQELDEAIVVGTTNSIEIDKLEGRISKLEGKPLLASSSVDLQPTPQPAIEYHSNPVSTMGGWGSSSRLSSGSSSGNAVRFSSPSAVQTVSGSSSGIASVQLKSASLLSAPIPIAAPVRTIAVNSPPIAAPMPIQRRDIVRIPVQRVTTQSVSYEQCPGGTCQSFRGVSRALRGRSLLGVVRNW